MAKAAEKAQDLPDDIKALSFEAAMGQLEQIVQALENGDVDLEKSIEMYGRGALLKRHCEAKLTAASEKVEKIVADGSGNATGVEPADID
jgi:exodeoxyribonuclease VII small subunit